MLGYIARRLLHTIPLLFGITLLSFLILQLAPGNYFTQLKLNPEIKEETIRQMEAEFALDKPVYVQYVRWLKEILVPIVDRVWGIPIIRPKLNFGYSFHIPRSCIYPDKGTFSKHFDPVPLCDGLLVGSGYPDRDLLCGSSAYVDGQDPLLFSLLRHVGAQFLPGFHSPLYRICDGMVPHRGTVRLGLRFFQRLREDPAKAALSYNSYGSSGHRGNGGAGEIDAGLHA